MTRTGGRAVPQTIPPGVLVPAGDVAQVAGWLTLLRDYLMGRVPPAAARHPHVTRTLQVYIDTLTAAAREQHAAQHHAAADRARRFADAPPDLGSAARPARPWTRPQEITTGQASEVLGCSPQHVRRLAASGALTGRRGDRDVWHLNRDSVISYRNNRGKGPDDRDRRPAQPPDGPPSDEHPRRTVPTTPDRPRPSRAPTPEGH